MRTKKQYRIQFNMLTLFTVIVFVTCAVVAVKGLFPHSKAEETSVDVVDILYTTGEESVTIQQTVVDKEIGNGRVWIDCVSAIQEHNANFISSEGKEFLGWKYVGSTIAGNSVTNTSAYTQGDHFTQEEYYSVSGSETQVTLEAVWGNRVYVDGTNGVDDANGLTATTPVRTMGRAYEILAQLDSQNPNANITGFKVTGDSATGYTYAEEDPTNRVTQFNGKIIVINSIQYEDQYEGRYEYITYGDLIHSTNYDASTGTVVFDDGVANKTITGVHTITGYSDSDPVKFKYISTNNYTALNKTANNGHHFLLKKVLNSYSYEVNGQTYYTYGRLTQYTESLRVHTGKGVMSPENDGLIVVSSKDGENDYKANTTFYFSGYARYASGCDMIYKDITLAFYHQKTLDVEHEDYVGGYAGNGYYLAFDENVTMYYKSGYYFYPNVYGGAHSYRYNSYKYTDTTGNGLGNSGSYGLNNTRITIKSGTYYAAYSGSYGHTVGRSVSTYGTSENNAAVINIYGGTFSRGAGMAHEGAKSYNSYVYVYGGTFGEIHGSGLGSSGSMTGNGHTNVLLAGDITVKTVYGGSGNGSHAGDIHVVFKQGTVSSTLYGGSQSKNVDGNIQITITGGTIKSVIGGCATGNVNGNVSINMSGGTVNGTIYTSGQGNTATENAQYYDGNKIEATGYKTQILDKTDPRLNLLITGSEDAPVIEYSMKSFNSAITQYHNDSTYTLNDTTYYYPHVYKSDYSSVINGFYRGTYTNYGVTQYTIYRQTAFLSLATVNNTSLNITGGTINGDIYGGGKVSVVKGDVTIHIGNATVNGNIYGGGDGTYEPTVTLYTITGSGQNDKKTETFTWKGSQYFDLSQYDFNKNVPIDYQNKYIYSPTYDYMGGVEGNVQIHIDEQTKIIGNVYGAGNAGNVFGTATIQIDSATISKKTADDLLSGNVYGGGDSGTVQGNTKVTIGNAENLGVTVEGLVYGGGKGYDADNDGDASDFTTVYGSSEVDIQGTYTYVENYGSVKLGKVAGNVDVAFTDYWTGNATSKYKTMNGIDRATTVTFSNSYVLLENKNENGDLVGIKDITNLVIPSGSGLKISANGEIAGNFTGGGELYLDSAVCLTVGGNISGVTTLILNPLLYTDLNMIKGGLQKPYMKVGGDVLTPTEQGQAVVSGEKKYTIYEASKEDTGTGYVYYYIPQDVTITSAISITSTNALDRVYQGKITNIDKSIYLLTDDAFTNVIHVQYELTESETLENEYTNIQRAFGLKIDKENLATLPKGTQLIMIANGTYYYYTLPSDMTQIPLTSFKNTDGQTYIELTNFTTSDLVDSELNQVTGHTTYRYQEDFRFIVDFYPADTQMQTGIYYPMLNLQDNQIWMGEEQSESAVNTVDIQNRNYAYTASLGKLKYENDSVVDIQGTLQLSAIPNVTTQDNKQLYARILLYQNNAPIAIPEGTIMTVKDTLYTLQNGSAVVTLLDTISSAEMTNNIDIQWDMSAVLPQNRLEAGEYTIQLQLIRGEEAILENTVQETVHIPLTILSYANTNGEIQYNYGIQAQLIDSANHAADTQQLITLGTEETRQIQLQYTGALEEPKVVMKMLEKTASFTYANTTNANAIVASVNGVETKEITSLNEHTTIDVTFKEKLSAGTYRIVFELYDVYGTKKTECLVNFIVTESDDT